MDGAGGGGFAICPVAEGFRAGRAFLPGVFLLHLTGVHLGGAASPVLGTELGQKGRGGQTSLLSSKALPHAGASG